MAVSQRRIEYRTVNAAIHPALREFLCSVETITGTAKAAPIELTVVRIGDATLRQVRADFMRSWRGTSVLGMSGLNHFAGYGVRGDVLRLR